MNSPLAEVSVRGVAAPEEAVDALPSRRRKGQQPCEAIGLKTLRRRA